MTDSSGQPAFEGDYKPFGEEASATGSEKYAFTSQYNEAEIGLYYFGARWYDASLRRFISEDPLKGSMISSQSQNPYVYCMNNPLRYIDPSGMMGDIPDWSAPPDLFADSVGTAESVVGALSDFLDGVINGCHSVDPADNEGRFDDIAGLPDAPPEGSPAGGNPGEDGEYNSPDYQCPIEIHLNFTATIISADYSVMYDQKTNRVVDRFSVSGGGTAGAKTISQLIDCAASPVGWSATVKNIDIDFDTYLNTPATHNVIAGYQGGVDVSVGDSNGDGVLEVFSHGFGYVSPGVSTTNGAPFYSTPIFTEGGVIYDLFQDIFS